MPTQEAFRLVTGGVLPYLTRFGVHVLGVSEGTALQLFLPALAGTIAGAVPAGYAADPLLIDLTPPERAAEITGLGSGVWSLSQPIGAVMAGVLITSFDSYRASFVGAASLVLLSFLLLLTVRPSRARTLR